MNMGDKDPVALTSSTEQGNSSWFSVSASPLVCLWLGRKQYWTEKVYQDHFQ